MFYHCFCIYPSRYKSHNWKIFYSLGLMFFYDAEFKELVKATGEKYEYKGFANLGYFTGIGGELKIYRKLLMRVELDYNFGKISSFKYTKASDPELKDTYVHYIDNDGNSKKLNLNLNNFTLKFGIGFCFNIK